MASQIEFDIHDSLKQYLSDPSSIATPEADSALLDCENEPENLETALINSVLNPIIDAVAENPDAILHSSHFDSIQFLLKCAPSSPSYRTYICDSDHEPIISRYSTTIPPVSLSKILDLVVSGLSAEADIIHNDLETEDVGTVQHHKKLLEVYAFLLQWTIAAVETKAAEKSASGSASVARARGGKASKAKTSNKDTWDAGNQIQIALDVMSKVLKLRLAAFFVTTSERDTFIGLFNRAVYLVQESEARMKLTAIRMHTFKVLCIAVKHHGHAYGTHGFLRLLREEC